MKSLPSYSSLMSCQRCGLMKCSCMRMADALKRDSALGGGDVSKRGGRQDIVLGLVVGPSFLSATPLCFPSATFVTPTGIAAAADIDLVTLAPVPSLTTTRLFL
ncbi:BQ5605_C105g13173 [Microbotryum silenes-dioicae]|uniref:BQ5605_C105g13173 protein n=1 Tax=Microbotryum silenes-dioicae TaxID=796604 RepID=A0A2X0NB67_9BASI|nr:BQ5605_C105g13173 [Microbotryum silenes-dioicae]